ncbi:MAG: SpaH/EbpB family LPXTG-anchored major pilin [Coriobacteriia bacterium]|nr:SpaH/EbpB family LPXTG-anchored major pilin [Coriobacteriia bacterium]
MKKVLSILLAVVMLMSFVSIAGADDPDNGGSLTITKYLITNDITPNAPNDGRQAGTYGNPAIPVGAELLEGITFRITKVVPSDTVTDWAYTDASDPSNPVVVYYEPDTGPEAFSDTAETDGDGEAVFADLPRGLYYVEELASPLVTDPVAPFFVSMPTYLDDSTELWEVFAYPKNEDLKIDKFVVVGGDDYKANGYAIGDTVTWKIIADVPTDIAAAKKYDIVDVYSQGLRFNPTSVVVREVGETDTLAGLYTVIDPVDTPDDDGGQFTVSFDPDKLGDLEGIKQIEILFTTLVLDTAPLNEVMPNVVELQYRNRYFGDGSYGESIETTRGPEIDPVVFTGGIRIYKHDAVNEEVALQGAEFKLVAKPTPTSTFPTGPDIYLKDASGNDVLGVSDANGNVSFEGIPYGGPLLASEMHLLASQSSEYWLVETAAPAGYRLPSGGWKVVTIDINSWDGDALAVKLTDKVANVKGFNFPLTGGMGTLAFILAGSALAAAAYGSHKMGRKERELA